MIVLLLETRKCHHRDSMNRNTKRQTEHSEIATNLDILLKQEELSEAELARRTKLPPTTIHRLLIGETPNPRASTLSAIAKYFGVSIEQLIGDVPLHYAHEQKSEWKSVPIIQWPDTLTWVFQKNNFTPYSHTHWIATEKECSHQCFAVQAMPFMEPRFKRDSILIVEPEYPIKDGKYVLITLDNVSVTVRKIRLDGSVILLENFHENLPIETYNPKIHRILGTIIESRVTF